MILNSICLLIQIISKKGNMCNIKMMLFLISFSKNNKYVIIYFNNIYVFWMNLKITDII